MSIRTKLFLSYAAVILLALLLAGAASIVLRRREQRQATLDRLAVAAPQMQYDLLRLQASRPTTDQVTEYVRDAARARGVRVLLVDRSGMVTVDSGDSLTGKKLDIPANAVTSGGGPEPVRYRLWEGQGTEQGDFVFLASSSLDRRPGPVGRIFPAGADPSGTVIVAVPRQTLARSWRTLLPGLVSAGLIALALSAVVAVLLARSIANPLRRLTRASEAMARGDYDQQIALRRSDEVGRLAGAFDVMAREVSRGHAQMRALIANVSHDLKTPLTSILGFSQALRDGAVGADEAVETGAIIHSEAERVQALVDDLLYLSEIEAGQVIVAREPVDLAALAARAARRFEPPLRDKGIALSVALPAEDGLTVLGDAAKLERVLDNLLDNARKYAPEGATVTVAGRRDTGPGGVPAARVSVTNTGSSIPPEELPRVFDRFHRVDRTRGRAGGSGLGLAIARELAELHGGTLTATSDDGSVTFTLTTPLAPADQRAGWGRPAGGQLTQATAAGPAPGR